MAPRSRTKKPEELKVTPEQHAHLIAIAPKKGGPSRNPKGRPAIPQEVKDLMATYSLEAVEVRAWLMRNSTNEMVRLKAAEGMTAPFVSNAAQESKLDVNVNVGVADFLARVNRRRANVIEAKPEDVTVIEHDSK